MKKIVMAVQRFSALKEQTALMSQLQEWVLNVLAVHLDTLETLKNAMVSRSQ